MKILVLAPFLLPLAVHAQEPDFAALEPPVSGSIGELRPEAGAFTTEVRRDGTLVVDGREVDWGEWQAALRTAAKAYPGEPLVLAGREVAVSSLDVVLDVDREVPWAVVLRMMTECSRPSVAAPQIYFGVSDEETGRRGTFAMFLPADSGGGAANRAPVELARLRIIDADSGSAHPTRMFAAFERMAGSTARGTQVVVEPQGNIRFSSVVGVADMAERAGVKSLMLGGMMTRDQLAAWNATHDLRAVVKAEAVIDGVFQFGPSRLVGGAVEVPKGRRQPVAGYAGARLGEVVEEEEEPQEEPVLPAPRGNGPAARPDAWNNQVGLGGVNIGRYRARRDGRRSIAKDRPKRATAIEQGLRWLQEHQNDDGSWSPAEGGDPLATTSLAVLALLGEGSTMRMGPYKTSIKAGIQWLRQQQKENGEFGDGTGQDPAGHAMATLAMVEAYIVSEFRLLAKYSDRALRRLRELRLPDGGWGRDGESTTLDTAWAALAIEAGAHSPFVASTELVAQVHEWMAGRRDAASGRFANGANPVPPRRDAAHAGAFPAEHGELPTASALVAMLFLGSRNAFEVDRESLARSAQVLSGRPPVWNEAIGSIDGVYWLFASDALRRLDERAFAAWSDAIDAAVLPHQRAGGDPQRGSWDPVSAWGDRGGRAWTTAIMVLTLQAPYRYSSER